MIGVHARLISQLEHDAGLNRELEDLPTEKVVADRRAQRRGLVSPELATLVAYCKIHLYEELLDSALPDDPYLVRDLERYFPDPLPERYRAQMATHRLRREIIATVVASQLVDRAGTTFAFRLAEETGASTSQLARAFAVAREVFEMRSFWSAVEKLDNQIEAHTQLEMLIDGRRLVERATRWLVRAYIRPLDIEQTTERYSAAGRMVEDALPGVLDGLDAEAFQHRLRALGEAGVPASLARRVASMQALLSVFDIVEDAAATDRSQRVVMMTYFALGSRLGLDWLRDRILDLPRADRWQALARAALRDDLYRLHRALTRDALSSAPAGADSERIIEAWKARVREPMQRALSVLADVKSSGTFDTTTLPVVLRELKSLVDDPASA
jgi:glutamate dehydrogenase